MKIETSRFGTLTLNDQDLLHFPQGLLGFSHLTEFVILEHKTGPFRWLQATQDPDIAFVVLELALLVDDYQLRLDDVDLEVLGVEAFTPEDVAILSIINVSKPSQPTANLLAPVCIAAESRCGVQIVQHHAGYSTRHPLPTSGRSTEDDQRRVA